MTGRVLRGAPASPGLAAGRARVLSPPSAAPARTPGVELDASLAALAEAAGELERIAGDLRGDDRAGEADIVATGALMAADPALEASVRKAVTARGLAAPAALLEAAEEHAAAIASLPDEVLAARADDVRSLGRRAARIAAGAPPMPDNGATFVLVAEDLGPADVAEHGDRLAAIVLSAGAVTAHAAIVARSLGVPMVVQAGSEALEVADGTQLVVDGGEASVAVDPSAELAATAEEASRAREEERARARASSALPAVTADGSRVRVLVNAATPAEVAAGLEFGAEGAGLIRTELAFLDRDRWPSKADHVRMLAPLLEGLSGLTATVRVLDFGGDKLPPFLAGERRRGIDLLLAHPGAFRAQLAAIAELAHDSELRVLLPLVRDAGEVALTRAMLGTVGGSALALGAMIELPEAAEAAGEIAAASDFLSIGTNDLTHATLGTDRFSHGEAPAHDPRVLHHIAAAVRAGTAAGIPVEVCGEAASDPLMVPLLVGLGVDELSVGAARVGAVRGWIRALDRSEASTLAERALAAAGAAEAEELLRPAALS